jgi:hypothetical protein
MKSFLITGAGALALIATAASADPSATEQPGQMPDATATQAPASYSAPTADMTEKMAAKDVATKADAGKLAESEFLRADRNVDGSIDQDEYALFAAEAANAENAPAADKPQIEKAFAAIAKEDGKISLEELTKARAKSFDAADANRDLSLDANERKKFAALVSATAKAPAKIQ